MKIFTWVACALAFGASSAIAGISGGAFRASSSPELLIVGPVEAIKEREGTAIVLGQKISLRKLGNAQVGESVSIFGTVRPDGSVSISGVVSNGQYVPGASPVLLTGVVQKISPLIGRAVINGLTVDLTTNLSASGSQSLTIGSLVQVSGTQPNDRGLILVQRLGAGAAQGISGGAAQGISGGAAQGISGGAAQGISGGAAQGISGGAAQGISGGAAQGISGGAAQGISGGAAQGISGGAAQGISGGAAQGISGGAAQGISGGARS
jgi:hypothetical protein